MSGPCDPFLVPRRVAMVLALTLLVFGLWGGLVRVGWTVPDTATEIVTMHGVVMVLGFLGTLISLERAAAIRRGWAFVAPAAAFAGASSLLLGAPLEVGGSLLALGGGVLVAVLVHLLRLQPTLHGGVLAAGAVLWVGGVGVWLAGRPLLDVVPWLGGFLVLTIAGERLELSRMSRLTPARRAAFLVACAVFVAGLVLSVGAFVPGLRTAGAGLVLLALWLGANDVARRTVRRPGLTRFIALALLAGYAWLGVAGVLWVRDAAVVAGPGRDAMLHALFLGFVMSMIFAHAPVIVPAVVGVAVPWRPAFYAHLALLHASLVLRVAADAAGAAALVRWGGLLNLVAVLV
ncbi:MAG: hypothetical protein ACE14W_03995, partial [Candidatus Velamenicoccus archaeovorus]